jgi:hypothetical protein
MILKQILKNLTISIPNDMKFDRKATDTCVNKKIKHRIHEGMWQAVYSQLGGFQFSV